MKKKPAPPPNSELRRLAEAKLSASKKDAAESTETNADMQRLVHELQVHQIELEMQNEELVQSRAELASTLSMYAELYAFAPVGYFTLTHDGTIRRANLTGAKLLETNLSDLINRRFAMFTSLESRATFNAFLDKVFISKNKQACDIAIQKNGADLLWVHIEAICETSLEKDNMCYAIVSDITERRQAEEALRQLSTHDMLTGLYNYGFFFVELARFEHSRKFPISILVTDVDQMKKTNDTEGHAAGDALLKRVAQLLTAAFRVEDVVARIGGDEFAVLLPDTDTDSAKFLLQRVQQVIQENNITHPEKPIHLSFGMSTADSTCPLTDVLKKADQNMYLEKRRNKID